MKKLKKDANSFEIYQVLLLKISKIILLLILMIHPDPSNGQPKIPMLEGETTYIFSDLMKQNGVTNFKAGLICSAQRNDTIFAVFYQSKINNIICLPLGCLNDTTDVSCYESTQESYYRRLRQSTSILCSNFVTSFNINEESIYIFKQILSAHMTVKSTDDSLIYQKARLVYYSNKKGVYNITYSNDYIDTSPPFQWSYIEGDFIF